MKTCIFCTIADKNIPYHEIVWESKDYIAFLDINPNKPGHTLVIPKKHSVNIIALTSEEYVSLFDACREVSHLLKESLKPDLVALVVEGMSVPHSHVHLIPLNKGEKMGHFEKIKTSSEELRAMAIKIKLGM